MIPSTKKENQIFNYTVPIEFTPCHFGGRRWWFKCPLELNGEACGRRSQILYLPPRAKYFGCRECHNLTYESRQRHRDFFYENRDKPNQILEKVRSQIFRVRSPRKLNRLIQQAELAQETLKNFHREFRKRVDRLSYP